MAVQALQAKEVDRIILTRPAVEAGERLGFLPGDLMAKVDPYLRPLYDALYDMVEPEGAQRLLERGTVEVAPLAFMRGRTLNGSFIILDEAQNTTPEQMKMFLTRIGFGSKVVVTGDVTQIDLPGGRSGLTASSADPRRHRRPRVRPPDGARRRAPPDRAGHRRRLRTDRHPCRHRSSAEPRADSTARRAHIARRLRPARRRGGRGEGVRCRRAAGGAGRRRALGRLARNVLEAEGVRGDAELSLLFVDEDTIAELNRRFMDADGPDRRAGVPHRRPVDAAADARGDASVRRRPEPLLLGDVVVCPAVAARQAPAHAGSSTTSWRCWWCTAFCTCSATTTPRPTRRRRCRPASASCSSASTSGGEGPAEYDPRRRPLRGRPMDAGRHRRAAGRILLLAGAETALARMPKSRAQILEPRAAAAPASSLSWSAAPTSS